MNFMPAIEYFLNMQLPPYIHGNIKHSVKRIPTLLPGHQNHAIEYLSTFRAATVADSSC